MKEELNSLAKAIVEAENCETLAIGLNDLVYGVMALEKAVWGKTLQDVFEYISNQVRIIHLISSPDSKHVPYYVISGMKATLMYLLNEIGPNPKVEPRWALAKMMHLASECKHADETPLPQLESLKAIFDHCENEFQCLSKRAGPVIFAIPDIDIECSAECSSSDNDLTMFVNRRDPNALETFAYEAVALSIAGDKVPMSAIKLMTKTTEPDIRALAEQEQYGEYLSALKLGLSYNGPSHEKVELTDQHEQFGQIWCEYIKKILK